MTAGGSLAALGLFIVGAGPAWPVQALAFAAMGCGFYMLHASIQVYVTEFAPATRSSAVAFHTFSFFIGGGISPILYGIGLRMAGRAGHAVDRRRRHGADRRDQRAASGEAEAGLTPPSIGRDALVRHPDALGQLARLPEHVDRNAAARIPVAADAQPLRLEQRRRAACRCRRCNPRGRQPGCGSSPDRASATSNSSSQPRRHIVDHEMREIRLAGDRAQHGEFRRGEARDIVGVRMRVRHAVELCRIGRGGQRHRTAELEGFLWPWACHGRGAGHDKGRSRL